MTKTFLTSFSLLLAAFICVPAKADIAALYETLSVDEFESKLDFAMTIEVNDEGDARLHVTGTSGYFLIINGEAYRIYRGIDGPYAERLADLEEVIANAGQSGGISLEVLDQFSTREIESIGAFQVSRWAGEGYAEPEPEYEWDEELYGNPSEEAADKTLSPRTPDLVVSKDKSLRPIGVAFAQLLNSRFGTLRAMSLISSFGSLSLFNENVRALISTGTPIKLGPLELSRISKQPIDNSRFELPKRVLTREEIEAQTQPFEWAPSFDRQPKG